MNGIAISLDRVSKKYRLHRGWYFSIRDELAQLVRRALHGTRTPREEFWALRDVSFHVRRGETLGLIGSNGAGKSTTLKILSRVTVPTRGTFVARGRVGALIEIGAGFHPELTGRENVYLNGAIMGMRRKEIDAKFESIVAFAEIEKFIDTPIKYYSSGMTVRLGFAIAAHLDPDILLVDEVLAVGDARFQAKCLNKLAELKARRKTVILVSHTMENILQHSNRVLWIDQGTVRACGDPEAIVEEYLRSVQAHLMTDARPMPVTAGSPILIRDVVVKDRRGGVAGTLEYNQPATVEISYEICGAVTNPVIGVTFHDVRGHLLGGLTSRLDGVKLDATRRCGRIGLVLSPVLFTRGAYSVTVTIYDERIQRCLDLRSRAATFTVDGPGVSTREVTGHLIYPHRWDVGPRD